MVTWHTKYGHGSKHWKGTWIEQTRQTLLPTGVQKPKLWRFGDFLSNGLVVLCSLGSPPLTLYKYQISLLVGSKTAHSGELGLVWLWRQNKRYFRGFHVFLCVRKMVQRCDVYGCSNVKANEKGKQGKPESGILERVTFSNEGSNAIDTKKTQTRNKSWWQQEQMLIKQWLILIPVTNKTEPGHSLANNFSNNVIRLRIENDARIYIAWC